MKTDRLRIGAWTSLKITLNVYDNMKKSHVFNDFKNLKSPRIG